MYSPQDTAEAVGFPIRISMDQSLFAAPHGFSQRTTSFIASQRQGIHQMPLRRLIALISQCPDNPNDTPWNEASPQLALAAGSPALERPVARICLSFPFRGRRAVRPAPPCPGRRLQRANVPRATARMSQIPSSQCQRSNRQAAKATGKCCLYRWVAALRMPNAIEDLVEPDGIEPTTSCLQSRRSPN